MKSIGKLLSILVFIPVLLLQPINVMADGDENPPHGRPEMGDETSLASSMVPGKDEKTDVATMTWQEVSQAGLNALEDLWSCIDGVAGIIR